MRASSKARRHVHRTPAGREADGNVAAGGMGDELAREDQLEAHVVGQGGEDGLVLDEAECGQRAAARGVAEQLRGSLGIGGAPAVPEGEEAAAPPKRSAMAAPAASTVSAQRSRVAVRRAELSSIFALRRAHEIRSRGRGRRALRPR